MVLFGVGGVYTALAGPPLYAPNGPQARGDGGGEVSQGRDINTQKQQKRKNKWWSRARRTAGIKSELEQHQLIIACLALRSKPVGDFGGNLAPRVGSDSSLGPLPMRRLLLRQGSRASDILRLSWRTEKRATSTSSVHIYYQAHSHPRDARHSPTYPLPPSGLHNTPRRGNTCIQRWDGQGLKSRASCSRVECDSLGPRAGSTKNPRGVLATCAAAGGV